MGQQRACIGCQTLEQEGENIRESARGYTYPYLAPPDQAAPPDEEG